MGFYQRRRAMYQGFSVGLVLLMGGSGLRFGGEVPKQFALLGDRKLYLHTLEACLKTSFFDEIVLVCHKDWIETVRQEVPIGTLVEGGRTRQQSSYLGLLGFQVPPQIVMIHDAVRPFLSSCIIQENIQGALLYGAVDTCIPSADTLVYAPKKTLIEKIPNREEYLRGQTPQTFQYQTILKAHEEAARDGVTFASDDCKLVLRQGLPVFIVPGSENNIKITTHFDLLVANSFVSYCFS